MPPAFAPSAFSCNSVANHNMSAHPISAETNVDDWDQHWTQFAKTSEVGPTPRYRRRLISSLFDFVPPGDSVRFLEIGSGTGEFAEDFCTLYPKASYLGLEKSRVGVDISAERVRQARFLQRDLLAPQSQDFQPYNATHALCSEVLEHVADPSLLLRNASAYCQTGCRLIVTVPGGPMNALYKRIGHVRHYSPEDLRQLLKNSGFEVEVAAGAGFPFYDLFRIMLSARGPQLVSDVSGPPSATIRVLSRIFDLLFRLNSRNRGWQTLAVARYLG